VNFTVDTSAPLISINAPRPSPFPTNAAAVQVQVGFDADAVRVTIGGEEAVIFRGTANRTITLPEGTTVIEVEATDRAGNMGRANVTVQADRTPPPLEVSNRQGGNVTTDSYVIVRGTSEPGAVVFVQGVPVETTNGSFEVLVRLDVGENQIDIRARDALGNQNVTSLVVHRGVVQPSTVLDAVFAVLGAVMVLVGGALLVYTLRREYKDTEMDRKRKRFHRGEKP
jgi:hypothetical protein